MQHYINTDQVVICKYYTFLISFSSFVVIRYCESSLMNNNRIHITFILVNLHRIHNRTNVLCHIIIIQHLLSAPFANKHDLMQYLNLNNDKYYINIKYKYL